MVHIIIPCLNFQHVLKLKIKINYLKLKVPCDHPHSHPHLTICHRPPHVLESTLHQIRPWTNQTQIDYHFVRDMVLLGETTTDFVNSGDQLTDITTKSLRSHDFICRKLDSYVPGFQLEKVLDSILNTS